MKRSSNLIGASNRKAFIGRMARAADCGGRATRAAFRALGPDENYLRMLRIRNGLNADTAHILSRMNTPESLGQTETDRLARERSARVSSELDTLSGAIPYLDKTGIDSLTGWLNNSSSGSASWYIPGGSPGGRVTRVMGLYGPSQYVVGGEGDRGTFEKDSPALAAKKRKEREAEEEEHRFMLQRDALDRAQAYLAGRLSGENPAPYDYKAELRDLGLNF